MNGTDKKIPCSNSPCEEFVMQKGSILCEKCLFAQKSKVHEKKCKDYDEINEKHRQVKTTLLESKFELEVEKEKNFEISKELATLKEYKEVAENNIQMFMQEIQNLRKNLEDLSEKKMKMEIEYNQQFLEMERLQILLEKHITENSELKVENLQLLSENKMILEDIAKLTAEHAELSNKVLDLSKPRSRSNTPSGTPVGILKKT